MGRLGLVGSGFSNWVNAVLIHFFVGRLGLVGSGFSNWVNVTV